MDLKITVSKRYWSMYCYLKKSTQYWHHQEGNAEEEQRCGYQLLCWMDAGEKESQHWEGNICSNSLTNSAPQNLPTLETTGDNFMDMGIMFSWWPHLAVAGASTTLLQHPPPHTLIKTATPKERTVHGVFTRIDSEEIDKRIFFFIQAGVKEETYWIKNRY